MNLRPSMMSSWPAEIERASHSILGKIEVEPGRGLFPLRVATARHFADKRIALVGEAAHVIPPIGAQGLNLGLRDAATIGELAVAAHREHRDIGGANVLANYDRLRRADVGSRTLAIDLLNRTLLSDFLPGSRRAWTWALSDRPHRAIAARRDARGRCTDDGATAADAWRGALAEFWCFFCTRSFPELRADRQWQCGQTFTRSSRNFVRK